MIVFSIKTGFIKLLFLQFKYSSMLFILAGFNLPSTLNKTKLLMNIWIMNIIKIIGLK